MVFVRNILKLLPLSAYFFTSSLLIDRFFTVSLICKLTEPLQVFIQSINKLIFFGENS
jgi:hypothetical protein